MKYNLSEIMKHAWRIVKSNCVGNTMSNALKIAWVAAKRNLKAAARETQRKTFDGYERIGDFAFSLWEKYGKRRIYIQNHASRNWRNESGYIDLDHDNRIVATGPVKMAAYDFLAAYIVR